MNDRDVFLGRLKGSEAAVFFVALMLHDRGESVTVPATFVAKSHSDWEDYADNGDLYVNLRMEVKRLSRSFTGLKDWPFGQKFIVCAKHSYDRAHPTPYAYYILSNDYSTYAQVFSRDAASWYVERKRDRGYSASEQEYYLSPLDKVKFVPIKKVQ